MNWDNYAGWHESVGYRFVQWTCTLAGLTAVQKARGYEKFAAEFDTMSPWWEPMTGWAAEMAWLCRRCAKIHRGEDPGPWVPDWERRRGTTAPAAHPPTAPEITHSADGQRKNHSEE